LKEGKMSRLLVKMLAVLALSVPVMWSAGAFAQEAGKTETKAPAAAEATKAPEGKKVVKKKAHKKHVKKVEKKKAAEKAPEGGASTEKK
jgi:Na+-transporting methylmalonyl-CoA/oxaloacetate decarboxylase gamma subunit